MPKIPPSAWASRGGRPPLDRHNRDQFRANESVKNRKLGNSLRGDGGAWRRCGDVVVVCCAFRPSLSGHDCGQKSKVLWKKKSFSHAPLQIALFFHDFSCRSLSLMTNSAAGALDAHVGVSATSPLCIAAACVNRLPPTASRRFVKSRDSRPIL